MLVFYMDKLHDLVYNSAPTKTAQSSCLQLDFYSQAWTPFWKWHDFVTTQHDCLLFWHLHIFHVRRRRGERWRIPETQVGVTFQGPPPVLRQWIHRPERRKALDVWKCDSLHATAVIRHPHSWMELVCVLLHHWRLKQVHIPANWASKQSH